MADWCMLDSISVAFGRVVQRRRGAVGLSQEQLAFAAGIDRSFVSKIEVGKVRLGLGIAKRIADAFDVPLSLVVAEAEAELEAG